MPWQPSDAHAHTHKADSPRRQRMFADIANKELERHGDEGEAIAAASAAVARDHERKSNGNEKRETDHWSAV